MQQGGYASASRRNPLVAERVDTVVDAVELSPCNPAIDARRTQAAVEQLSSADNTPLSRRHIHDANRVRFCPRAGQKGPQFGHGARLPPDPRRGWPHRRRRRDVCVAELSLGLQTTPGRTFSPPPPPFLARVAMGK